MTIAIGGHLLLAPASIAAGAVATMLGLVLVRLAQQTSGARTLRTPAPVMCHLKDGCMTRHESAFPALSHGSIQGSVLSKSDPIEPELTPANTGDLAPPDPPSATS